MLGTLLLVYVIRDNADRITECVKSGTKLFI